MPNAQPTYTISGLQWQFAPLGLPEQIELEVTFARVLGGGAAVAIGAAVQGLAPAVVEVLRDITGEGDSFDLVKIADLWSDEEGVGLDTSDPRLGRAWETLITALANTAGDVVVSAFPAITDRLTVVTAVRMMELIADRVYLVRDGGDSTHVKNLEMLSEILRRCPPGLKWRLLRSVVAVTYGGAVPVDAEPDEIDDITDEPAVA